MFWICPCKGQQCAKQQEDLDYKSHPGDLKTIERRPSGTCLTAQLANVFLLFKLFLTLKDAIYCLQPCICLS